MNTGDTVAVPTAAAGGTTLEIPPNPDPPDSKLIHKLPSPSTTGPPTGVLRPLAAEANEWMVTTEPKDPLE